MKKISWFALCCLVSVSTQLRAEVIDFEELNTFTLVTPTGAYYNGNSSGVDNNNGWNSGSAHFLNSYNAQFDSWQGWAYGNVVNTNSAGFFNQYAAFPGGGSNGAGGLDAGGNYAIAYTGSGTDNAGNSVESVSINLASAAGLVSIDISNTTYTALYARDGNDGGFTPDIVPFTDGDFFRVIITGYDGDNGTGTSTGQRIIDLINFGSSGAGDDIFLADWLNVDLSTFGLTKSLTFATESSRIESFAGFFYSAVPSYIAIDNLNIAAVPEPASMAMLCVAGAGYWLRRRRANKG